jgi:hypothetical protein
VQDGWTNGVADEAVVDLPTVNADDLGIHLGTVDPDLAALLSPNHLRTSEPALQVTIEAVSPRLRSPTSVGTVPSPPASPSQDITYRAIGTSSRSASLPHSLPSGHSPKMSMSASKASSSKLPGLPRLARSASERPSYSASDASSPKGSEASPRQSLQLPRRRPSPLFSEKSLPSRPRSSGTPEQESQRSGATRLATPIRHLTAGHSSRAGLRLIPSPQSSPGCDGTDSFSSRSPSAIGPASGRRLTSARPSLDVGDDRPRIYGRARSSSLTEGTPYEPPSKRPVDWLGPRTAKAFAAAGLLDGDRDTTTGPGSRPGSRFGFGTTRSERDFRSQYAPSRAGFSDFGSSVSRSHRSGSVSHTVASSEAISVLGTPLSDSMSGPRTTFSSVSTAPTSLSSSSVQRHLQEELSSLQEKHSLETGALLSALADSQRTTRMLRDENTQLRDRLQFVEEQLAAAREELQRQQFAQSFNPPSTSTLGRNNLYRLRGQSTTELGRRGYPPSRLQTLLRHSSDDLHAGKPANQTEQDVAHDPIPPRTTQDSASHTSSQRRRNSATSSIFPAPPRDMTMLLHDEDDASEESPAYSTVSGSQQPSPTLVVGKPLPRQGEESQPGHQLVSAGNISPTTANFSMVTGSPGSLYLRPEHERLLGDMPMLDLCADDYTHVDFQH